MSKKTKHPKTKTVVTEQDKGRCAQAPGSALSAEQEHIKRIKAAKKGKLIRVRCWTEENQSAAETHAETMIAAAVFIRQHAPYHANWLMEFRSEPPLVPDGLVKCGKCGWHHAPDDACVPNAKLTP